MTSGEEIERTFRQLTAKTRAAADARVLADASAALARGSRRPKGVFARRWRRIGALAALVPAAVLLAFMSFGKSSSIALADVRAAVNAKSWVHFRGDDGSESWVSLTDGKAYHKGPSFLAGKTRMLLVDDAANRRLSYTEGDAAIYEDEPTVYEDGKVPEWKPRTPWEYFLGWHERQLAHPGKFGRTERHEETVDGRKLVRFDDYYTDALGKDILVMQIWADAAMRLPVRSRARRQPGPEEKEKREWETGVYDFPDKGPGGLYDLGVPRGLSLVKTERRYFPEDVQALLEKAKAARDRFPTSYRAVVWDNDRDSEIDIIHRNGLMFRSDRYFDLGPEAPAYHLPRPATLEGVLKWASGQRPMGITVFDGGREFHRSNPYPEDVPAERFRTTTRVLRESAEGYFRTSGSPPVDFQWPFLNMGGPAEIVLHPEEAPAGCVAVRFGGAGDSRQDFYVDPARDCICIKSVGWEKKDGTWRKNGEQWLPYLRRLPGGQWCATRRMQAQYVDPEKGLGLHANYYSIDVKTLKDDEFPAGMFDGERLLEGAGAQTY